mmetsp:Transcript_7458/g.6729  ORF Transcript_7458/g.6729 Transcript_7458/m.6729 type:complete len:212 (-) Transcript_7458:1081-1716(-)
MDSAPKGVFLHLLAFRDVHLQKDIASVTVGCVDESLVDEGHQLLLLLAGEGRALLGAVEHRGHLRDLVAVTPKDRHSTDVQQAQLPLAIEGTYEGHLGHIEGVVKVECIANDLIHDSAHFNVLSCVHLHSCLKGNIEVFLHLHFEEALEEDLNVRLLFVGVVYVQIEGHVLQRWRMRTRLLSLELKGRERSLQPYEVPVLLHLPSQSQHEH